MLFNVPRWIVESCGVLAEAFRMLFGVHESVFEIGKRKKEKLDIGNRRFEPIGNNPSAKNFTFYLL